MSLPIALKRFFNVMAPRKRVIEFPSLELFFNVLAPRKRITNCVDSQKAWLDKYESLE